MVQIGKKAKEQGIYCLKPSTPLTKGQFSGS